MSDCDVIVVGAGPGGCAIAYYLNQAGWQVTLVERLTYPTDKLCGEFLSPEGVTSLCHLGLAETLSQMHPPAIDQVLISSSRGSTWQAQLPAAGLGLSRRNLDHTLLMHCQKAGVRVLQGVQVRDIDKEADHCFNLRGTRPTGPVQLKSRLLIGAFGKQSILHRKLRQPDHQKPASQPTRQLIALKLYATGSHLPRRVELHAFPGGYAGMSDIEEGRTSICLLSETSALRRAGNQFERFGNEIMSQNPVLRDRLKTLQPDWSSAFAIANLSFGSHADLSYPIPVVGDAAASISPLCGDGMSMALRTAELLAPLANQFLQGHLNHQSMIESYTQRWQREFAYRLRIGQGLQAAFFNPLMGHATLSLLNLFPALGQRLIRWTRGSQSQR